MSNESRRLYQAFTLKGMSKEDAFFAVLDHFRDLHCFDRDRYAEETKQLKARIAKLEKASEPE
jgi:hypothetical protein